jgi:myo-inositol-1(or 4)-monophosphatase
MPADPKKFIIRTILKSGEFARQGFFSNDKTSWKHHQDPVTPTDLKINDYFISQIKKHYPDHSIISEEVPDEINDSDYAWYIDPIDGTIPFSQRIPYFCISVGLAKNNRIIMAAVLDPIHNELFFSQKGEGTFLNGQKIISRARQSLRESYIDFSVWKRAPYKLLDFQNYLNGRCYVASHHACLVLSSCYVACGRMDAAVFAGNTPWDVATISLICGEAKVKCTNLDGTVWQPGQKPKGQIIARPKLQRELLDILKKRFSRSIRSI